MNKKMWKNEKKGSAKSKIATAAFGMVLTVALLFTSILNTGAVGSESLSISDSQAESQVSQQVAPETEAEQQPEGDASAAESDAAAAQDSGTEQTTGSEPAQEPAAPAEDAQAKEKAGNRAALAAPAEIVALAGVPADNIAPGGITVAGIILGDMIGGVDGQDYWLKSGDQAYADIIYSSDKDFPAGRLAFRVKVPQGVLVALAANTNFSSQIGTASAPDTSVTGETDGDATYDYYWLTVNVPVTNGTGKSLQIKVTPDKNGVTNHGHATPVDVVPYVLNYNDDGADRYDVNGTGRTSANLLALVDVFNWNPATFSSTKNNINNNSGNDIGAFALTFTTANGAASATTGVAFAEKAMFENTFTIPLADNGEPYVLIKVGDITLPDGITGEVVATGTKNIGGVDYYTGFTIKGTVNNVAPITANPANFSLTANVAAASFNGPAILEKTGIAPGASTNFAITSTVANGTNTVTPAYAVGVSGNTANNKTPVSVEKAADWNLNFTFKNTAQAGNETAGQTLGKQIISIGSTSTIESKAEDLVAYPDDTVTYAIGAGIENKQNDPLTELVFAEVAGTGYNPEEMVPQTVYFGAYANAADLGSTAVQVQVTYSDGSSPASSSVLPLSAITGSESYTIPNAENAASVKVVYTNVHPDFKIPAIAAGSTNSLRIVYKVVSRDEARHGDKFTNTATMDYKYTNSVTNTVYDTTVAGTTKSGSVSYTFKIAPDGLDGRYQYNKYGQNLTSPGQFPKANDVLLFTIELKSDLSGAIELDKLIDTYSSSVAAYDPDFAAGSANEQYNSSAVANFKIWSPSGVSLANVTNDGTNRAFTVTFPAGAQLQPGETLRITYTMKVASNFTSTGTIQNRFDLYDTRYPNPVASGKFSWKKPTPSYGGGVKAWYNLGADVSATTAKPIPDDVMLFKIVLENKTTADTWTDLTLSDSYTDNLAAHSGLAGINPDLLSSLGYTLATGNVLNLTLVASETTADVVFNPGALSTTATGFSLPLGGSIAPGKKATFVYTLKVLDSPSDTLVANWFDLASGSKTVSSGYCETTIDGYINKTGSIYINKEAKPIAENGYTPNKNSLQNGDKLQFVVRVQNRHSRVGRTIYVKNMTDVLPSYLDLDESSIEALQYTLVSGDYTTTPIPSSYSYDDGTRKLQVSLDNFAALTSDSTGGKADDYIEFTFTVTVNTESLASQTGTSYKIRNEAYAYFQEDLDKLSLISGSKLVADGTENGGADGDDATKAAASAQTEELTVYNDRLMYADLTKTTTTASVNASTTSLSRSYTVTLVNYSSADLPLGKMLDVLPRFETLDTSQAPVLKVTEAGDSPQTLTYNLNYEVLGTPYVDADGNNHSRVQFTSYVKGGVNQPLTLSRALKKGTQTTKFEFVYYTKVNAAEALQYFKELGSNAYSGTNSAAIYPAQAGTTIYAKNAGNGYQNTHEGEDGTNNWDSDLSTNFSFYNSVNVAVTANSTAPYVNVTPYVVDETSGNEYYTPYNPDSSKIEPSHIVAWELAYGNGNTGTAPIEEGAKLVAVLPAGLTYEGMAYTNGTSTPTVVPSYFGEPEVKTNTGTGETILIWTLQPGQSFAANNGGSFRIRTGTDATQYAVYGVKTFWVPTGADNQFFYDKVVENSNQYASYKFTHEWGSIEPTLTGIPANSHYVRKAASVDVFGQLGVRSRMLLTDGTTTVESTSDNRVLSIDDRQKPLTYTMEVSVPESNYKMQDLVLINRLPQTGDREVTTAAGRASEANVRLIDDGAFAAQLGAADISGQMTVEYMEGGPADSFTAADWSGAANSKWKTAAEIGSDFSKVTAVRIRFTSGFELAKGDVLSVSYQAMLYNYNEAGKLANNSFAFYGKMGNTEFNIEPASVGVLSTKVPSNTFRVHKILNENADAPTYKTFALEFTGKSETGGADITKTATVEVTTQNGSVWEGTANVTLPLGYTYTVKEQQRSQFAEPVYSKVTEKANADGSFTWDITIQNTPIKYTVTYDNNRAGGSQTDPQSPYYTGDTVVVMDKGGMFLDRRTFAGWNTNADGSGQWYYPGNTFVITQDVLLYAQWEGGTPPPASSSSSSRVNPPASSSSAPAVSSSASSAASSSSSRAAASTGSGSSASTGSISDGDLPLGRAQAWALLNLILTILGLVTSVVLIIAAFFGNNKDDEEEEKNNSYAEDEEEEKAKRKSGILWRLLAIVTSVASLVVFLLTEDMRLPMVFTDKWTLLMVLLAVIEVIFIVIMVKARKQNKRDDEEEENYE
ncbi:MAG: InlB B-repeat-containing protein [Oscillospiraceae bacterium]